MLYSFEWSATARDAHVASCVYVTYFIFGDNWIFRQRYEQRYPFDLYYQHVACSSVRGFAWARAMEVRLVDSIKYVPCVAAELRRIHGGRQHDGVES